MPLQLHCPFPLRALAAATLACALTAHAQTTPPAAAPATVRSYDVSAQPLGSALARIAAQSGQQISINADLVRGHTAPAVRGDYTAEQAARAALAGSGLELVRTDSGNWSLTPGTTTPHSATGSHALPTVTVSGKAEGSTTEGTGSYTTGSTSSSTRLNLTPQETPQSVTVITRQRMDDQKLSSVVDALDATAGIIVQRGTIGQDSPAIYARGHTVQNYQIDGVPVFSTMSPFLNNTAAFDRVEIVRGATGIMNGLGTPAATVNMIRKRPTAAPHVELTTEAGSWNRHGMGIDASGALNEDKSLRGRMVVDYKHENAWVDRFKQKGTTAYGIAELDVGRDTLVTAGFSHLDQRTNSAIQERPLYFSDGTRTPLTPASNTSQSWRFYDHKSSTVFGSVEHRLSRTWVAKAEYSHTEYHYDGLVSPIWTAADASGTGSRLFPNRWNSKPRQDNLDVYATGTFPLFGRTHEAIAGVTLARMKATSFSYSRDASYSTNINYYDWAQAPEPVFTQSGTSKSSERQQNAFLSTRFSLTDATSLLLGGRLTHWQLDDENSGSGYRMKENVLVPYVGVVHAINDTWSLYGSYTKIFRPQDYYVIELNGTPADPEEGIGYEAGVKGRFFDGRLTSSIALFQTQLKNLAVWNADNDRYDILGLTKTRGVELELNGELTKSWQLTAGYALAQSKDENGARVLTYVPRQNFKLFTTYRLPGEWNKLTVGVGANWQSSVNTTGLSVEHREGSVALANLMARYAVNKNLTVSLNLNNALNKEYFSTIANNYGTYGAPRNFMVSAKYAF